MPPAVRADETPVVLQTEEGPTLCWRGIDFYPRKDPVSYARRKARVFSPLPQSLYYVPSLGLGHGLVELLEGLPPGSAVLCVEAFQEVMGVALRHGVHRDPRLLIIRTEEPDGALAALRSLGTGRFRRVVELPLCAGYRLAPEAYASIRHALEQEIMQFWQNRLTLIAMGSLQVRNLLSNIPLLAGAADFSALSTPLPVVVAGAGPSVEAALPVLSARRRRFALVAVDTALPVLRESGLTADVVVDIEAQAVNTRDFIPAPRGPGPWLACDLSVHPSVPRLFPRRVSFFSSELAPLRLWDRLSANGLRPMPFPALGSVGVAAAHAALLLTSAPVFLAGLDFAFPGSRTHARGSPFLIAELERSERLQPVGQAGFEALAIRRLLRSPDKHGQPVMTDRVMRSYRDALEKEARSARQQVYDCGPTGLPLGVRMLPLQELSDVLARSPETDERIRVDRGRGFSADRVRPFLADERQRLARMVEAAARSAGPAAGELEEILADVDYAWAHFPDRPEPSSSAASFVARAAVAARFYDERLRRIQESL